MPNWCYNNISFGDKDTLNAFLDKVNPGNIEHDIHTFSFDWLIPAPKTKEEALEKYPHYVLKEGDDGHMMHKKDREWFNWYDWNTTYWGTKWDACDVLIDGSDLSFSTAWGTPDPIFDKIADIMEELELLGDLDITYTTDYDFMDCGYYVNDSRSTFPANDEKEAARIHEDVEHVPYFYDEYDDSWHCVYDDGVFKDSWGDLHYFDVWNPEENEDKAYEMHDEFGECFDNMLKSNIACGNITKEFYEKITAV